MLTTVSFPSLRLGKLILTQTKTRNSDSSVSLTGGHAVQLYQPDLESGTFLMGQHQFQNKVLMHHSIETEEMMEQSI